MKGITVRPYFAIICILALAACTTTPEAPSNASQRTSDIVCNAPYIRFAATCCLDKNNNNICDTDETASEALLIENKTAEILNNTAPVPQTETLPTNLQPPDTREYLERFQNAPAKIIFNPEGKAGFVAASTNLMSYYAFPKDMRVSWEIPEGMANTETNLILLGDACSNPYTAEIFATTPENCDLGLRAHQAILKTAKINGKQVLIIAGHDETDTYDLVNMLIKDQIPYTGTEVRMELS